MKLKDFFSLNEENFKFIFFLEAIKLRDVIPYLKGKREYYKNSKIKDWFQGKWRVVVDLIYTPEEENQKNTQEENPLKKEIEEVLKKEFPEYEIRDYLKGIVYDKKRKTILKLGKILNKINRKDLLQKYANAPERQGIKKESSKLKVVISRHPYDILGQSTNRGWTSCKNIYTGANKHYLVDEIFQTIVAYLVHENDLNINNPIARLLAVPIIDKFHKIYYVVPKEVYGDAGIYEDAFIKTFENWLLEKQGKIPPGRYVLSPFVYQQYLCHIENVDKMFNTIEIK